VRSTDRAGTKVGSSDPAAQIGMAVAQRIKGTPGITGLSPPRVQEGPKGMAVRHLKRYASWV